MNTKSSAKFENLVDELFSLNEKDQLELEKQLLSAKFLSEIQKIADDNNFLRKQLAQKIGTSPSYLTQLFRGDKVLNLETIVKFQNALNIKFEIKAVSIEEENDLFSEEEEIDTLIEKLQEKSQGFVVFRPMKEDTEEFTEDLEKVELENSGLQIA